MEDGEGLYKDLQLPSCHVGRSSSSMGGSDWLGENQAIDGVRVGILDVRNILPDGSWNLSEES